MLEECGRRAAGLCILHKGFCFSGVGLAEGGCCILKNKIVPPDKSWQEVSLRVLTSEGLFIKWARCVQLSGDSVPPKTWQMQSPREGCLGWAHRALVAAMRDTQSHKLTLKYHIYWWLWFILC